MSEWLNSNEGLPSIGLAAPKNSTFKIDAEGKVYIENSDGSITPTSIIFKPGRELYGNDQTIRSILDNFDKQARADANQGGVDSDEDPAGLNN